MKKLILAIIPALLLLLLPASLQAQDAREGTLGIRLDGGLSWSLGGDFANSGKNALTLIQPQGVVGLFYNFSSRFRMGLDYGYTRMIREQTNGTMNALPGGGIAGEVYRNLKNHFHAAELTGEFNLLGEGPLSLYLGAGAGCQFVVGNTYTIAVKNEVKPGGIGNTIHVRICVLAASGCERWRRLPPHPGREERVFGQEPAVRDPRSSFQSFEIKKEYHHENFQE